MRQPLALWVGFLVAVVAVVGSVAAFNNNRHNPSASAVVLAAEVTASTSAPRPTAAPTTTLPSTTSTTSTISAPSTTTVPPTTTAVTTTSSAAPRVITVTTTSTTEPETTTTDAATTTTTIAATTTTSTPAARTIDLRVKAAFVGPPVANRATFVSVTVSNAGPHAALAPRVGVVGPSEYTDVVSLEPAWLCARISTGLTCDGPVIPGGSSTSFALRGTLSEDIVLQSDRPLASSNKPGVLTPQPLQFAVHDEAIGATDTDPNSDTAQLPFPSTISGKGLATLTARTLHGGLAMTGNTLLACDPATPACASAMVSGDNVSAVMTPTNTLAGTVAGTTVSSSATLQLASGATVSEAYLVWGAASMDGSSLVPDGLAVAWLSTPASGLALVRTSLQSAGTNDFYARADVTDLVRQQGSGVYGFGLVGGLAGVNGSNQSAGWALVVIYEHATEPVRSVVVLDGLSVMGGGPSTTVELGALGPVAATRPAQVGFVTFDGDRGQADVVCLNGVRVNDAVNPTKVGPCDQAYPTDDAFNSTISQHGVLQPVDAAGHTTSLGFDADLIDTAVPVDVASRLTITATADVVRVGLIAIVIDR
jgi:hypothetical protein